jgi:hypothetical protein
MSASDLGLNHTFIFGGTNYDLWKIRMLDYFWVMDPNMERILDMGFSIPKDRKDYSSKDKKNSHLNAQATNVLYHSLSKVVLRTIVHSCNAHVIWTKLQDKYEVSKICEDDCPPSTPGRDEFSSSATSQICDLSQGNDMVSGDRNCFDDVESTINDTSTLSHCNDLSLDSNSSSTPNGSHASIVSPCISCSSCSTKHHDDMLPMSCCHDKNTSFSSSMCVANNVEETKDSSGQDKISNGASSSSSSSSPNVSHFCLMARGSKISPPLKSSTSCNDEDEDIYEEKKHIESLKKKGEIVLRALPKGSNAFSTFFEILAIAIENKKIITKLEVLNDEHEEQIEKLENLTNDLHMNFEESQATNETLEETSTLELSKAKETRDRALKVAIDLEGKYEKLIVTYAQLKASSSKELPKLPSPIDIDNDACGTNSIPCEASIVKENVELRAQLELITSKYGKLEETHEKLSSSNEDLLASHAHLKLAHEAISTKVTSCEPHVVTSTISTKNVILPCASPSDSSSHTIAKTCDELLPIPCCSNNEASTSSSTCVVTNHVGMSKENKAQVSSLKKNLENRHEGNSTLNKILSMQKSPNDKSGLGFKSNTKNKSKMIKKKKGQE